MAFVYSCCFWFSLRLGGILIGIFSLVQALIVLIGCGLAYTHPDRAKDDIAMWTHNMILIYTKDYIDDILTNFNRYVTFGITVTCLYIVACILFIYGAYTFQNILLIGFILAELIRLLFLSVLVATGLLVLKQNTMDIGLLIGASVAGGFLLLGMFYLWVCALNLPVLINEMERDEQAATIAKLRQVLEMTNSNQLRAAQGLDDHIPLANDKNRGPIYTVPRKKGNEFVSRIPVSFYSNVN
ncbi:uncharacterized protein LOC133521369 isoform X1 [Cydia pomonella]|uniref:uncharacterized protein LOC133521369 isoform X1 n=2 Tax=Cydia pomonella TaxID=82600 RepID=UPI002ADD7704|nr:uncharacterized protein LOC133521369 isoform X1 [Cydia pomonella]